MTHVAQIVESYFSVKWEKGRTALEAFELGRDAAARVLEKRAAEIRGLKFDAFKAQVCHASVNADSRRD